MYKVGDKVKVRKDLVVGKKYGGRKVTPKISSYAGQTVTIRYHSEVPDYYEIEEDGSEIVWAEEMFEPTNREIRILVDGNTVTATEGKYKGIARCSPEDEFTIMEGARLAVERLEKSKKWPQIGDDCFKVTFCGSLGRFTAVKESVGSIDLPAAGKLILRTKKEAQAQADRLNKVLEETTHG